MSSICICAMWIRPMIFCVPTPLATPAHLLSTSRMMLHRSAHSALIIVIWAPESTNAVVRHADGHIVSEALGLLLGGVEGLRF